MLAWRGRGPARPTGRDEQAASRGNVTRNLDQDRIAGRIDPVQIFQDDQHGRTPGPTLEQPTQKIDEHALLRLGVEPGVFAIPQDVQQEQRVQRVPGSPDLIHAARDFHPRFHLVGARQDGEDEPQEAADDRIGRIRLE